MNSSVHLISEINSGNTKINSINLKFPPTISLARSPNIPRHFGKRLPSYQPLIEIVKSQAHQLPRNAQAHASKVTSNMRAIKLKRNGRVCLIITGISGNAHSPRDSKVRDPSISISSRVSCPHLED